MKKFLFIFASITIFFITFILSNSQKTKPTIGIIVPMQHAALTEMIQGFKETLPDLTIKVLNAGADQTLQKSIIEQLIHEKCDLLVPIGTQTSQMTLHLSKTQNVLCLAANTDIAATNPRATVLDDECTVQKGFCILHDLFPEIKKISLVHSTSDKIYQELEILEKIAKEKGICLQKLSVFSLPDLYTIGQAIDGDSQAILVLKDHLIVSGISTLVKQAEQKQIPVITSDNGSVSNGASLAIGIKEFDIGKEGAFLAKQILEGQKPQTTVRLEGPLHIFLNAKACSLQGVCLDLVSSRAKELDLCIDYIGENP